LQNSKPAVILSKHGTTYTA